jgi:EAL domain-containing protein (putative c-di-GMP-specific phosphodiesterase class I)/GGDEF domain-containing protein
MFFSAPNRTSSSLPRRAISTLAGGPQILAFLPAVTLAAYWLGGEPLLLVTAVLVPALFAVAGFPYPSVEAPARPPTGNDELPGRTSAVARADSFIGAGDGAPAFSVMAIGLDDAEEAAGRLGPAGFRQVTSQIGARLVTAVRSTDLVAQLTPSTFAIVLASPRSSDLETLLQVASRLQDAAAEPLALGATRVYLSASVGIARQDRRHGSGEALVLAAERAVAEAMAHGPCSVRLWSETTLVPARAAGGLAAEVAEAIAAGQIVPWFQPQVRTETGVPTGAEALARWVHPVRGIIAPQVFLPAVEEAGLSDRLGATMLHASLAALKSFDTAGHALPCVAVNFSAEELRNPGIVDRVRWELDRFDLTPDRLTVEVLETVLDKTGDDMVTRSLAGFAALGCKIDLDDFGTGHAAIGSIRRFSVNRVKIDRSFVRRIDMDADQQNVVSAMILMAERLGLDTLAEGIETAAEQTVLARLGCHHVQGFAIARPMPEAAFLHWLAARGTQAAPLPARPALTGSGPSAEATGKTA